MNKREAKRRVCLSVASIILGHIDSGAGYLYDDLSEADAVRTTNAVVDLAVELDMRGQKHDSGAWFTASNRREEG